MCSPLAKLSRLLRVHDCSLKMEAVSLRSWHPSILLGTVANALATSQISAVYFVSTTKARHQNLAAVQYMTEMVSSMGIPVMVWALDQFAPVKVMFVN